MRDRARKKGPSTRGSGDQGSGKAPSSTNKGAPESKRKNPGSSVEEAPSGAKPQKRKKPDSEDKEASKDEEAGAPQEEEGSLWEGVQKQRAENSQVVPEKHEAEAEKEQTELEKLIQSSPEAMQLPVMAWESVEIVFALAARGAAHQDEEEGDGYVEDDEEEEDPPPPRQPATKPATKPTQQARPAGPNRSRAPPTRATSKKSPLKRQGIVVVALLFAVLDPASALEYVLRNNGTCGSQQITSEAACRAAAEEMGLPFEGAVISELMPSSACFERQNPAYAPPGCLFFDRSGYSDTSYPKERSCMDDRRRRRNYYNGRRRASVSPTPYPCNTGVRWNAAATYSLTAGYNCMETWRRRQSSPPPPPETNSDRDCSGWRPTYTPMCPNCPHYSYDQTFGRWCPDLDTGSGTRRRYRFECRENVMRRRYSRSTTDFAEKFAKGYSCVCSCRCDAGSYCDPTSDGHITTRPCPPGTYSNRTGATACTKCRAGTYSTQEGASLNTTCESCSMGFYSNVTGANSSATCIECPLGHQCPSRDGVEPCQGGTFSDTTQRTACKTCAAGKYCPPVAASQTTCPQGHYCQEGSAAPVLCAAGTYADVTGLGACKACAAGTYCLQGATHQIICPKGHYCQVDASPILCAPGTFADITGLTSCKQCHPGKYCGQGAAIEVVCPEGHYCEAGSPMPVQCAPGTFADAAGLGSCKPCDQGKYCLRGATHQITCPTGYYCASVDKAPVQCPIGHPHSNQASVSLSQCFRPSAYYAIESGACPPNQVITTGVECEAAALSLNWPATSAVPSRSQDTPYGCFLEKRSLEYSAQLSSTPCAWNFKCACAGCSAKPGQLCNPENNYAVSVCPAGKFSPNEAATSCQTCPEDTYSREGATQCESCPGLYYSDVGSTSRQSCTMSTGLTILFFFLGGCASCCAVAGAVFACSEKARKLLREWWPTQKAEAKEGAPDVEFQRIDGADGTLERQPVDPIDLGNVDRESSEIPH